MEHSVVRGASIVNNSMISHVVIWFSGEIWFKVPFLVLLPCLKTRQRCFTALNFIERVSVG